MATSNVNGNKGLSANLLPKFYQTPSNKKFLQSTIDQLFQPGSLTKVSGYVGRENAKASVGTDLYIEASDKLRQDYQLEPSAVIQDYLGNTAFFKDYIDHINHTFFNKELKIIEVFLEESETLSPKVTAIPQSDGSIISMPLEDMAPFLSRDTLLKEMIIPLHPDSIKVNV